MTKIRFFKTRNGYDFALPFIGVGFGFAVLEKALYSSALRLPVFAMHSVFGLIMGVFLGKSRFMKLQGESSGKDTFPGLFLPVRRHTLFDSAAAFSALPESEVESAQTSGMVFGLITVILSAILQFALLIRFKKKTDESCFLMIR